MRCLGKLCILGILIGVAACGQKSSAPNVEAGKGGDGNGGNTTPPKVDYQAKFGQLIVEIKHKSPARRSAAIKGIVEYKDEAIAPLLEILSDKGISDGPSYPGEPRSTREAGVIALVRIGPAGEKALLDTGLKTLLAGLSEPNPIVLEHTITAIGLIGPSANSAARNIGKHCASGNENVRRAAYDALTRVKAKPSDVVDLVMPLLTDADPKIAFDAARALSSIRPLPKEAIGSLIRQIKVDPASLPNAEEYAFVRNEIADALASFGDRAKEAVPALIDLLKSTKEEDYVRLFKPNPASNDESPAMTALRRIGKPAVPQLAELLDNAKGFVRWQAARALAGIGPDAKEAQPALQASFDKELSRDMPELLAYVAMAQALVQTGVEPKEPVAKLAELLKQTNDQVRFETLRALARFGRQGESAVIAIIPLLDDKEVAISVQAADTLRAIGSAAKAAIPALTKKLADDDLQVRRNALRTLRSFGAVGAETVPAVTKLLADKDDVFRREVIEVIVAIGPAAKAAVPDLAKLLKSEDERERLLALDALAAIGSEAKAAAKDVLPLLASRESETRLLALKALGGMGNSSPEVVTAVSGRLKDDLKPVRNAAARTLALFGPGAKDAVPALQAFGNPKFPDPIASVWSATALYRIGSDADANLKIVVAALKNTEPAGRLGRLEAMDAAEYLGAGAKGVLPDLIAALSDNTPIRASDKTPVRVRAVAALGKMGPAAKDAVPKISNMLKESDATVKRAALAALGQIGPAAAFALPRLREIIRVEPLYAEQAQEVLDRIEAK